MLLLENVFHIYTWKILGKQEIVSDLRNSYFEIEFITYILFGDRFFKLDFDRKIENTYLK